MLTVAAGIEGLARFGRALADPIRCRVLPVLGGRGGLRRIGGIRGRRAPYTVRDLDERLGHALDDLRTAVVAVETDRTCGDVEAEGCR
ncbi:transcriptional regulator [Streptomyces sp. NPDC052309]|uniref:transcriptional regulator n=1 Tax=Streptomyces sp. NPDC052309 TaxID=3155421 RepID=UPI00343C3E87